MSRCLKCEEVGKLGDWVRCGPNGSDDKWECYECRDEERRKSVIKIKKEMEERGW